MKRYCVRVTRERRESNTYEETALVTVAADSEEEAMEKVEARYEDEANDWDWDSMTIDIDEEGDDPTFTIAEGVLGDPNLTCEDADLLDASGSTSDV